MPYSFTATDDPGSILVSVTAMEALLTHKPSHVNIQRLRSEILQIVNNSELAPEQDVIARVREVVDALPRPNGLQKQLKDNVGALLLGTNDNGLETGTDQLPDLAGLSLSRFVNDIYDLRSRIVHGSIDYRREPQGSSFLTRPLRSLLKALLREALRRPDVAVSLKNNGGVKG